MGSTGGKRSFLLFLPLLLGALLVFFPRRGTTVAVARDVPSSPAGLGGEELVFLVQYVGSDYRGAVADGKITESDLERLTLTDDIDEAVALMVKGRDLR